jgi:hypothetical protein
MRVTWRSVAKTPVRAHDLTPHTPHTPHYKPHYKPRYTPHTAYTPHFKPQTPPYTPQPNPQVSSTNFTTMGYTVRDDKVVVAVCTSEVLRKLLWV